MGKIYNFVLNSQIASAVSAYTFEEEYFIDWSLLPMTKYKVIFSFMSANQVSTNVSVANIYLDLGQGSSVKLATPTGRTSLKSSFLGCLEIRSYTNSTPVSGSYLFASTTTNPPIYLESRPQNNNVQVQIDQSATATDVSYLPISGQYTMILSLESLD